MSNSRSQSRSRSEGIVYVRGAMEGVVLVLVAGLPWAFGGVDPALEMVQALAIAMLIIGWACIACLNGRLSWARCPVTVILAALFLLGTLQLAPLPNFLLKVASPGTASLNSELLPDQPERLTAEAPAPQPAAMRPITIYPHASRADLFHWFEVLILFAVIRHQLASTGSMRRLAIVAVITGVGIALFGLFQTFRFGGHRVFGFETLGEAFGPFINRNHAAAFLNLCLGLGVGLLVHLGSDSAEYKRQMVQKPNAVVEQEDASVFSPFSVLHSPMQLWLLVALAIIAAGVMCTLSRGGVASILVAFFVAGLLRLTWPLRIRRLEFLILPAVLVFALLAWLGIRVGETRLASLWKSDIVSDMRWEIWTSVITKAPSFPIFGCGYGTFGYLEPLTRQHAGELQMGDYWVDHAHNDYLEGLIEGGLLRLALTALLVGLIFSFGWRAMRRYLNRNPGTFAFGGMIAFIALAIHSAVDFSLQTPAVACLATVLVAQLVSLNRSDPTMPPSGAHARVLTLRFPPIGLALVTLFALALGGVLILHSWRADRVFRFRLAAFHSLRDEATRNFDDALRYLNAAVALDPTDADLQVEIGQVYLDRPVNSDSERMSESILPGLQHMIAARNSCPLLARPQLRLAVFGPEVKRQYSEASFDPPERYWERAALLAPTDPDLWYLRGRDAYKREKFDLAWDYWRRALELARRYRESVFTTKFLDPVVTAAYPRLGVRGLLERLMPNDPDVLVKTADILAPKSNPDSLRPLFARALELLDQHPDERSAANFLLRARCAEKLGDWDKALRSYREAIELNPQQIEWRWLYARLLHRQGKLKEAFEQLKLLVNLAPNRNEFKDEKEAVEREINIE